MSTGSAVRYETRGPLPPSSGGPGFEVSLDATRRKAVNDNEAEHSVMLRSLIRW